SMTTRARSFRFPPATMWRGAWTARSSPAWSPTTGSTRMRRVRWRSTWRIAWPSRHTVYDEDEKAKKENDDMRLISSVLAVTCLGLAGVGCSKSSSEAPKPPAAPVTINVIDAAGTLQLVQDAMEAYRGKNPTRVEKFTFTKAPAPELPGKIKAMQAAGR